jgi:hypothetical protein
MLVSPANYLIVLEEEAEVDVELKPVEGAAR